MAALFLLIFALFACSFLSGRTLRARELIGETQLTLETLQDPVDCFPVSWSSRSWLAGPVGLPPFSDSSSIFNPWIHCHCPSRAYACLWNDDQFSCGICDAWVSVKSAIIWGFPLQFKHQCNFVSASASATGCPAMPCPRMYHCSTETSVLLLPGLAGTPPTRFFQIWNLHWP